MSRPAGIIGSGIVAAAAFGFMFWWINNIHQLNGVGLLRRQDWPINSPWLWAAAGFAVGTFGRLVQTLHQADHARKTRQLAETLGRENAESCSLPAEANSMPVFEGWTNGRHAMTGSECGVPVALFDYTTVTEGGESNTVTDGTAVLLPADGLPDFDLRPRTFGRRILGWAGFEGMTFDSASVDPADVETVQQFTGLFYLAPMDPMSMMRELVERMPKETPGGLLPLPSVDPVGMMSEITVNRPPEWVGREEAVRRLFSSALMAAINPYPEYAIQSRHGFLAIWRGSSVLRAHKRTELWDAAVELRMLLTHPPQRGGAPRGGDRRTGRDGCGPAAAEGAKHPRWHGDRCFRRLYSLRNGHLYRVLRLPAGAGAVGRTGLLHPAATVLRSDSGRRDDRGSYCLSAAGAEPAARAGGGPGPAKRPPAGDRLRRPDRVLYGILRRVRLLRGQQDLPGLEIRLRDRGGALFFGSIFSGGLLGAVACGIAVNRCYRWRQRR